MAGRRAEVGEGRVILVGAGPGDPELITLRGLRALEAADCVVHDALAAPELLARARPEAEVVDVGKRGHREPRVAQLEIEALLVERALAGRVVVRLKGGDPFVFGRGGEEVSACLRAGVPVEVVPGVTSAIAVPAAAGIPLTQRGCAGSFAVLTGHRDPASRARLRVREAAAAVDTVVVLMGMGSIEEIAADVAAVRGPDLPAAAVMWGTTKRQRAVRGTAADLAARVAAAGLSAPSVLVFGDVVGRG